MLAREIMTKNPRTLTPGSTAQEAAQLMEQEDVGIIPVVADDGRRLVGVVTDRDLALRVVGANKLPAECRVQDVMSTKVSTARAEDDVDQVMELMGREQVRRIPVVDERGSLVGIVAQADIVREAPSDRKAEKTVERISEPNR